MLPEALVIFACVNSTGCPETSSLYFSKYPLIKQQIDKDTETVRKYVGPTVVDVIGPTLFAVAGGTGNIHISKHFNLQISKDHGTLTFSWMF